MQFISDNVIISRKCGELLCSTLKNSSEVLCKGVVRGSCAGSGGVVRGLVRGPGCLWDRVATGNLGFTMLRCRFVCTGADFVRNGRPHLSVNLSTLGLFL